MFHPKTQLQLQTMSVQEITAYKEECRQNMRQTGMEARAMSFYQVASEALIKTKKREASEASEAKTSSDAKTANRIDSITRNLSSGIGDVKEQSLELRRLLRLGKHADAPADAPATA